MKKFIFKLETLLNIKKKKEELITQKLSKVQAQKLNVINEINKIKNKISDLFNNYKNLKMTVLDINFMFLNQNYINYLEKELNSLNEQLNNIQIEENKIKDELNQAMKERKILEKLKENQFEQYKKEYNKQDNLIMDEIANTLTIINQNEKN